MAGRLSIASIALYYTVRFCGKCNSETQAHMAVMQLDSLVQLVGSGNRATVEEEWLKLVESDRVAPTDFCRYAAVLSELVKKGESDQAEALAWTALESWRGRSTPQDSLSVVGAMLLALKDSPQLRKEAVTLYRQAYEGREGLETLITASGIEGGRPARRALRTLDVCLAVTGGSYVLDRHEPIAARVESIDYADWIVRFKDHHGASSLEAVPFADRFEPVASDDFRVLKQFDRDALMTKLGHEPARIVEELCRAGGGQITSEQIEAALVPEVLSAAEWKKWWTRARSGLKHRANLRTEGRSPIVIAYDPNVVSTEGAWLVDFDALRDSAAQWELVERYLRECKQKKTSPDEALLQTFHERFESAARRHIQAGARVALREALLARRCGALLEIAPKDDLPVEVLRHAPDVKASLHALTDERMLAEAFVCLRQARPDDWVGLYVDRLLTVPAGVCDDLANALIDAGHGQSEFRPLIDRVLANPLDHHEALLWLYDGPDRESRIHAIPLLTLATRVLGVLSDLRRDGVISKDESTRIINRSRSVLALRKYERFTQAIDDIELGMAQALRNQIRRLDSLGRVVQQDLLKELSLRHSFHEKPVETPPWLREDVIFVSARGMARRHADIEHHVNVKMKENARAIGAAAEHGDLSENSEYKFALEERDLLRAQLARMNEEMAKAQVIDEASIPTDHVGIGSRATLRRVDAVETIDLTFVGPWEADLNTHRYNYFAPFARQLMGKRVGERVSLDLDAVRGEFEITSIENGLA